jgi:hypothetical protein
MRHNGRPVIAVSTLPPDRVNLRPGEIPAVACPFCGRWRRVKRHMLWPHRANDGVTRCQGSGQRLVFDLSPGEWLVRLEAARRSVRPARSLQRCVEQAFRQARAARRVGPERPPDLPAPLSDSAPVAVGLGALPCRTVRRPARH